MHMHTYMHMHMYKCTQRGADGPYYRPHYRPYYRPYYRPRLAHPEPHPLGNLGHNPSHLLHFLGI